MPSGIVINAAMADLLECADDGVVNAATSVERRDVAVGVGEEGGVEPVEAVDDQRLHHGEQRQRGKHAGRVDQRASRPGCGLPGALDETRGGAEDDKEGSDRRGVTVIANPPPRPRPRK